MGVREVEEKEEIKYVITAPDGAIGCLTKNYFLQMEDYVRKGNLAAVQKLLNDEICFFLSKGTKLYAVEGTCADFENMNDISPFKPNDFLMLQPYLRCKSVELVN